MNHLQAAVVQGVVVLAMVAAFEVFVWKTNAWNIRESIKAWVKR